MKGFRAVKISLIFVTVLLATFAVNSYILQKVFPDSSQDGTSNINQTTEAPKVPQNEIKEHAFVLPKVSMADQVCEMKKTCDPDKEIPFKVVSGTASVVGPSVCIAGEWLMRDSLGNVGRGLNVAVVDGMTGTMTKTMTFDLYGVANKAFVTFLENLQDTEIAFMTTYDDASKNLKDDARAVLVDLGSKKAKTLGFRDNWIFVSGQKIRHAVFENYVKNDDTKANKYGKWPSTIMLEDCLSKLR